MTKELEALAKLDHLEAGKKELKTELKKDLLLQAINPDTFKCDKPAKACVMLKDKIPTVHNFYRAKFPQDFVLQITTGAGKKSVHNLNDFAHLEDLHLLDSRKKK